MFTGSFRTLRVGDYVRYLKVTHDDSLSLVAFSRCVNRCGYITDIDDPYIMVTGFLPLNTYTFPCYIEELELITEEEFKLQQLTDTVEY